MMFTCFFLHSMSHLQNVIDHHRSSCSPLEQKHGSPHRPLQTSRVVPPLQCKPWWKRYVFVLPDMKCMRTGERLNLNWSQFILMTQFIIFILYILCFLLFLIWSLQVYFVVTCIFKAVRSHFFLLRIKWPTKNGSPARLCEPTTSTPSVYVTKNEIGWLKPATEESNFGFPRKNLGISSNLPYLMRKKWWQRMAKRAFN